MATSVDLARRSHAPEWEPTRGRSLSTLACSWRDPERRGSHTWLWAVALVAAILTGAAFRLVFVDDIEYKGDERWTYCHAKDIASGLSFPMLGMPSSAGIRNPGMSIWVFAALAKIYPPGDARDLARAVQILNIAAIVLLLVFVWRVVPREEREPWLWAAALVSLNPIAVLFHRKIWPPCVLPLFSLLFLTAWWHRGRQVWAFVWGLVGACLGQIHMAGFFFTAAFAGWAFLFDRRGVAWRGWFLGTCLGAAPLIPWLSYVANGKGPQEIEATDWQHLPDGKYWMRWVTEPFGVSVEYTLGDDFEDYLGWPVVYGQPTYLVAVLHVMMVGIGAVLLARALRWLWANRARALELWTGKSSATAFTQGAALWGLGILLTASTVPVTRHYLIILFPLTFVWVARIALVPCGERVSAFKFARGALLTLCVVQALITASFLGYVHANQRMIHGEYWIPFAAQVGVPDPWQNADAN